MSPMNVDKEKAPTVKVEAMNDKFNAESIVRDITANGAKAKQSGKGDPIRAALSADTAASDWLDEANGVRSFMTPCGDKYLRVSGGVELVSGNSKIAVCGPLDVLGRIYSAETEEWMYLLEWIDLSGRKHNKVVSMQELTKNPAQVVSELAGGGLKIKHRVSATGGSTYIAAYIRDYPTPKELKGIRKYGWERDSVGETFCLPPALTIGAHDDEPIVFVGDESQAPAYRSRGTLQEWQERIAVPALYSSRLSFSLCFAFAPVLMDFVSAETGGFNLYGESSSGKSTCARVCCSVWAPADENGEVGSWRTTDNGLEAIAAAHNSLPLILDELGQAEPEKLEQIVYMLGNNKGKTRANKSGGARTPAAWKLLVLSTGETTIEEYASKVRYRRDDVKAGVRLRLADLPAVTGQQGVFDHLPGNLDPIEVAGGINESAKRDCYGVAGPAFVRALIAHVGKVGKFRFEDTLRKRMNEWLGRYCRSKDSQVVRVASRFALVAAAGELAIELGILSCWTAGTAARMVAECYTAWRSEFKTAEMVGSELVQSAVDRIAAMTDHFHLFRGEARQSYLPNKMSPLYGYLVLVPDGEDVQTAYIIPEMFRENICPHGELKATLRALEDRGALDYNDRQRKQKRRAGKAQFLDNRIPLRAAYCIRIERIQNREMVA